MSSQVCASQDVRSIPEKCRFQWNNQKFCEEKGRTTCIHAKYFHEHFSGKARLSEEFWRTKQKTVAADGVKMEE